MSARKSDTYNLNTLKTDHSRCQIRLYFVAADPFSGQPYFKLVEGFCAMKIAKISVSVPSKVSKATEAALKKTLDVLVAAQKSVVDLLAAVEKLDPLAPASTKELLKQQKITKGRAAVFKDFAKSAKRSELHTNPAKLKAMIKSLNSDIAAANGVEGGVAGHLDAFFQVQMNDIEDEITRALPKGVSGASIGLSGTLDRFKRKQSKLGWTRFSSARGPLIRECRDQGEEQDRKNKINGMMHDPEFRKIKIKKREKIVKAGVANLRATAKSVKAELEDAFEKQDKPGRNKWSTYLQLGAGGRYRVNKCGSYLGNKIHWTMSNDSWTANADGRVSIKDNSVDRIFSGILETTDWKQLHATLEVGSDARDWPHVFLFAGVLNNDRRWANAKSMLDVDNSWITKAQAQMNAELTKIRTDLKKKIKLAKDRGGANM